MFVKLSAVTLGSNVLTHGKTLNRRLGANEELWATDVGVLVKFPDKQESMLPYAALVALEAEAENGFTAAFSPHPPAPAPSASLPPAPKVEQKVEQRSKWGK